MSNNSSNNKTFFEAFDILFNNVPYAVYLLNRQNKFIYVNEYAEKMYGYQKEEFIGKTPEFLSAPGKNDFEKIKEYHKLAFEGKPQRFYFWGKNKEGGIFEKEVRLHDAELFNEKIIIATGEDISEIRKLEKESSINFERYKTIVENSNNLIIIIKDGRIVFANNYSKKILGYELSELINKPFSDFLLPEDKERLLKNYKERIKGNEEKLPKRYTIKLLSKTGDLKYFSVFPARIPWDNDYAIMEILQDITENVTQKQRLETLQQIIEKSDDVILERIIENGKEYCKFVTANIKRLAGYSPEEFYNGTISIFSIVYEEDKNKLINKLNEFTKPGNYNLKHYIRLIRKDKKIIFVELNISVEKNNFPEQTTFNAILRDVTKDYLQKKELEERKKNYDLLINNMQEAIIIIQNFTIIFANKYATKITDYNYEELMGINLEKLIFKEDLPIIKDRCIRRLNNETNIPVNYEIRFLRKDGSIRWLNVNPIVIEWKKKPAVIAFLRDITKEKINYEKLRENEYYYRTISENINEALTILNKNYEILYNNNSFLELIEAKNNIELEKFDFLQLFNPNEVELVSKFLSFNFIRKNPNKKIEVKIQTLRNNKKWILLKSTLIDWNGEDAVISILTDITEQKLAELKARENEQLLEYLLESTKEDIFCFKDGEGRWLKANSTDLDLFDLNGVDYYGKTDAELAVYSPFYKEAFLTCMETDNICWEKGSISRGDEIIKRPDGSEVVLDVIKIPIFNPDGSRKMLIVFGRDVTKQRIAEKKLRDSEELYKTLVDNLHEALFVTQNGLLKFYNKSFKNLLKYNDEELKKTTIVQLIHPEDRAKSIEINENGFNMRLSSEPYEFRILTKNNSEIWVLNRTIRINWQGNNETVLNLMRDITEEKKALQQLHKLSIAVEQSQQGFIILDKQNKIEYANPYIYSLFDMNENEIVGQNLDIIKMKMVNENEISQISEALLDEKTWNGEVRLQDKSGNLFWGYLILTPMKNIDGKLTNFLIIILNIDKLKKIENELRIAKEKAEKSDQLKNFFLMQMSHEIRTPINALLSFSGLLASELGDSIDEDLKETFKSMERAGMRIIRTVDLLLNMSEIYVGTYEFHPQKIDLDKLVHQIYFDYKPIAEEKNIELNYHNLVSNPILPAHDLHSVNQIILNLVDNAIKYTEKGEVTITIDKNPLNEIFISVKDTGIGISDEYINELFTPFSQEDKGYTRKFEGNGLGLALIKEFAKLNNAKIDVESEKGKGSTFTVTFRAK